MSYQRPTLSRALTFLECCALTAALVVNLPAAGAAGTPDDPTAGFGPTTRELSFEQNLGQHDPRVDFVVRSAGYTGFLSGGDVHLRLEPAGAGELPSGLVLELDGAAGTTARGEQPLAGRSHYLRGADPERWVRDVPHVARVRYPQVYPGIDAVYRGAGGALEVDFVVAPGADPSRIALDVKGAESVTLDGDGSLVIETASGDLRQRPPVAFQRRPGGGVDRVEAAFALAGGRVAYELGEWDRERELIIDPPLTFSTFLGGALAELGNDVAVDASGNAYVVGWTRSDDFPVTPGVYQETKIGPSSQGNLFLSKLDPTGTTLLYSTFLGASSHVEGEAVAVDGFGQAYVLAQAGPLSNLLTTANAVQSAVGLFNHTYVAKFDAAGSSILYATFLTGSNGSNPGDLAVDAIGDVYVAGVATGLGFPMNGFQTSVAGIGDVFLVKLDPMAPSSLVYATFLGGSGGESADALAVDAAGRAYLTGYTQSANFPTLNAIQPTRGGSSDAYATAVDPGATGAASLIYSTYLGGGSTENDTVDDGGVAVDDLGYATYGGTTTSTDLPTTAGVLQPGFAGASDAFVYRLDPAGAKVFATYFGGSGIEQLKDLDADSSGHIALFGYTLSIDLPVFEAFQPNRTNSADAFLSVLSPPATTLVQSSYLGGNASAAEHAAAVVFDEDSCSLLAAGHAAPGSALAPFPVTQDSFQPDHHGETDAFLVKWPYCVPNQPPAGVADAYGAFEDQPLVISAAAGVLANDSDPDGDPLTASLDNQATHGMVTLAADGSFTYQPTTPDYNGPDTFTYIVADALETAGPVLVTLDVAPVNDVPLALPDSAATTAGTAVAIDVLANDSDVDGDALVVTGVTQGAAGSVAILPNFEVEYTPDFGFVGVDTFTYLASDQNGGTASALVTVAVEPGTFEVPVDIVPGKCPSGLKLKGGGKVKLAVASTATLDATTVDPASVQVLGLSPVQALVKDSATPYAPFLGKTLATDCHALGADGLDDLELRFDKKDLIAALEAANGGPLASGQVIVVPLTGNLLPAFGGSMIVGEDVILIQ